MDRITLDKRPTVRKTLPQSGTVHLEWDPETSKVVVVDEAGTKSPLGSSGLSAILTVLGIPSFADLATANASGAIDIGKPFYNLATLKLDITTA